MSNQRYLATGEVVELVETLPKNRSLVQIMGTAWEGDGETEYVVDGPLRLVDSRDVFTKPVTARLDGAISAKQAELKALEQKVCEMRQSAREAEKEAEARMARIKQYEPLKLLDDYLAGKITCYVVLRDGHSCSGIYPARLEPGEREYGSRSAFKLLHLSATWDGTAAWTINKANDSDVVVPCLSEDEARATLQRWCNEKAPNWGYQAYRLATARKYNLTIEQRWLDKESELKRAEAEAAVKSAADSLATAQAKLAALQAPGGAA